MDAGRRAGKAAAAAPTPNNKPGVSRHHTSDVLDVDQMHKSAGTPGTRHTRQSNVARQQASSKHQGNSRGSRRNTPDDVVMLDVSDSEFHSLSGADSEDNTPQHRQSGSNKGAAGAQELVISDSEATSDESECEDEPGHQYSQQQQRQQSHGRPQRAHKKPSRFLQESSTSGSEESEEESSQSSDSEQEQSSQQAADEASSSDSEQRNSQDSSSSDADTHEENAPFQATRASSRKMSEGGAKQQVTTDSRTNPARRGRSAAAAQVEATPSRSTRSAAATPRSTCKALGVATPHSTKRTMAASEATPCGRKGAAAAAPPSSRPVRSCTKANKAAEAQQPSLATPLAKMSLKAAATPKQPTAKQLRSAAAAAATPSRSSKPKQKQQQQQRGGGKPGGSSSDSHAVGDSLECVDVDGEVFGPGDDVYLALDAFDHLSDEEEGCEECGSSSCRRGNAILECSRCLRGFHLRCLSPPLKSVPEGDWFCTDCNAGRAPPPPAKLVTRWQKLLYGKDQLVLVHILTCQRGKDPDGKEEDQVQVRYYLLPEETHVGRQKEHNARELFLGSKVFLEPAQAIVGRAHVRHPSRFAEVQEEEGNDVFLCEYEYDETWKRFRARRYGRDGRAVSSVHRVDDDHDGLLLGHFDAASCPATPGEKLLAGLSSSWGARQRNRIGDEFEFDESGRTGDSDSDYDSDHDSEGEEDYRPDFGQQLRGARTAVKRKRHGKLPAAALTAAASDRFAALGATSIEQQRQQQRDACAALHASLSLAAVPASLPCRDDERTRLQGFVGRALHEDGGILYICGVPGTGKTALVMEVLGGLREEARQAGAQFVAINCLQLPSPQHVFSRLWEKLSGQHLGPARARDSLMQLFHVAAGGGVARRRYSTIIVLDEIDMLMTRDQAVLYQLFDWPSQPGSRLAVIGISNTHDLDQRVLPRIASRLDQAKLAFGPYSVNQLMTIAQGRLDGSGYAGAVDSMAVQLACRKVASETGDVRRALEMLRRAVEIARQRHLADLVANGKQGIAAAAATGGASSSSQQSQQSVLDIQWKEGDAPLVERGDVRQAQQEMFSALHHQLLRSRSCWEKVLLVATVVEARATGRNAVVIQSVCERAANSIAALVDLTPPSLGVLQHCLVKLASVRLLLSDGSHIKAHVALNVDKDDIALAVKEDQRLQRLHQLL